MGCADRTTRQGCAWFVLLAKPRDLVRSHSFIMVSSASAGTLSRFVTSCRHWIPRVRYHAKHDLVTRRRVTGEQ